MKEQFVPYEIALELKKLGFNYECFGYYSNEYNLEIGLPEKYTDICHGNPKEGTYRRVGLISAPLYQQAFDWFRNNYLLHSSVDFDMIKETDEDDIELYNYRINEQWSIGKEYYDYSYGFKHIDHKCHFRSYEEARIECLKKLIVVVKNK